MTTLPAFIRFVASALLGGTLILGTAWASPPAGDPFSSFDLPDDWESRFWGQPGVERLRTAGPKDLAAMVPNQAGLRFCRCPACGAAEADDPLAWSSTRPDVLTCHRCAASFPVGRPPVSSETGSTEPAKSQEETIEVRPGIVHKYPYITMDPSQAAYPEERVYLAAKRDYEAREFLSKAALYAAVRHREQSPSARDPALARLACVLLVRFAQVYPLYSCHFDQPGQPKYFQSADSQPPYRRGYRTAKWDWSGAHDVPLNLVIAYALLREDPALAEAGRALGVADPRRTIEQDLLQASARFVRCQPEDDSELTVLAVRGLLAVGRCLRDPDLMHEAVGRFDRYCRRGFYHDGLCREGDLASHRRVLDLIDGWIDRLLSGYTDPSGFQPAAGVRFSGIQGAAIVPQVALARHAAAAPLPTTPASEVRQVAWPAPQPPRRSREPMLLGGAGLVRLAVGSGPDALDLELRGLGGVAWNRSNRLALRLAVAGHPVLGDLDDLPPSLDGFDRASASHNTVQIDGLNQRETSELAQLRAPGADILFFAADPDLQVAVLDDRHAYPTSASRYRCLVAAVTGPRTRYAVSLFEVEGGLQHDQYWHAAPGLGATWKLASAKAAGPESLLAPGLKFLPDARAESGRWFVQGPGAIRGLTQARLDRPASAELTGAGHGVRLHLLGDAPSQAVVGQSSDPLGATRTDRAALVLRRRTVDGSTLRTRYVTVFEPTGGSFTSLQGVGRIESPPGTVVLVIQSSDGVEHLVINLQPGTPRTLRLADGRTLTTDGLLVRASESGLVLAGGEMATLGDLTVRQRGVAGTIRGAQRVLSGPAQGVFFTQAPVQDAETLSGRALLIRHADGTSRGWTIERAENDGAQGGRLFVREEAGFHVDGGTGEAVYDQYPGARHPGPHRFAVARIAR